MLTIIDGFAIYLIIKSVSFWEMVQEENAEDKGFKMIVYLIYLFAALSLLWKQTTL